MGCFGRKIVADGDAIAFGDRPTRLVACGDRRRGVGVRDSASTDWFVDFPELLALTLALALILELPSAALTCCSTSPAPNAPVPYGSTSACAIRNCGAAGG